MNEEILKWLEQHKNRVIIFLIVLVALDVIIFGRIFEINASSQDLKLYFLNVGQGDSEFVELPASGPGGGVQVLIDGGPANGRALSELEKVLAPTDRYIDLVILSHAQLDHFGGLIDVFKRYRIGAFIYNGIAGTAPAFNDLKKVLDEKGIEIIEVKAGDKISYQDSIFNVVSPDDKLLKSKETNDTSLVMILTSNNSKTIFTGDSTFDVENEVLKFYSAPVDILKVAHHGSKYSSSANFLEALKPKVAVIEVGKNSYGHPTPETLNRLADSGAQIFRTDEDGLIKLESDGSALRIFKIQ